MDRKLDLKFDKICSAESMEGAKLGHEMEEIVLGIKKKKKVGPACRKHGSEGQADSPTGQEVLHKFLKQGSIFL